MTPTEDGPLSANVLAVIVGATRLHDAIYYSGHVKELPDDVKRAYGQLAGALFRVERSDRP